MWTLLGIHGTVKTNTSFQPYKSFPFSSITPVSHLAIILAERTVKVVGAEGRGKRAMWSACFRWRYYGSDGSEQHGGREKVYGILDVGKLLIEMTS